MQLLQFFVVVITCTFLMQRFVCAYTKPGAVRLLACSPFILYVLSFPFQLDSDAGIISRGTFTGFCFLAIIKIIGFALGRGPLVFKEWSFLQFFIVLATMITPWEFNDKERVSQDTLGQQDFDHSYPNNGAQNNGMQGTERRKCYPFYDPQTRIGYTHLQIVFWNITKVAIMLPLSALTVYLQDRISIYLRTYLYVFMLYLLLEFVLNLTCLSVQPILDVPIMLPFARPFLSESFKNFWGKRWNTAVGGTLRTCTYQPVKSVFQSRFIGEATGLFVTFLMSSILHEYMVGYFCGYATGENALFFTLQWAIILFEEWCSKSGVYVKQKVLRVVIALGTLCFLGTHLFLPPYIRCGAAEGALDEVESCFKGIVQIFFAR
eukprot:TRINITY_DN5332_c0_g1_i11.p1 TRINITY_DN5332_c0_g1~~TRINITY_DN5332_c0_g1_i11.p1  ORF type:complete len:377 (+),score=15.79 TRINITY_DN5332_c0_g1_i11:101-1231(+)